jgi:hypothetical protein
MVMLLLICLLVGVVLGQRLRVLVLMPATVLVLVATAGFAHAGTFWQILGAALVTATSLQIGYLVGAGIHSFLAAARIRRMHVGSLPASTSPQRVAN